MSDQVLAGLPGVQDGAAAYRQAFRAGLRPDPVLPVTVWARRHRVLPKTTSAAAGPYDDARTPFFREPMDKLSVHDPCREVWLMKASQVGATTFAENWIGYLMDNAGGPILAFLPTKDLAEGWGRQRIQPMIDSSPTFEGKVAQQRSRDAGNTLTYKEFVGGFLKIAGTNSPRSFRGLSARNVLLDELDGFELDIGGEGDGVDLARKRTSTFRNVYKLLGLSTPTIRGFSLIEREFLKTNQQYWHVPCPFCGLLQPIFRRDLVWDPGDPTSVRMVCRGCEQGIEEYHKSTIIPAGRWIATAEAERPFVEGYHISRLYSPLGWYSWEDIAREWLDANRQGREATKVYVNQVLAETFEEEGAGAEPDGLLARAEEYPAEVPEGVLVPTCGVDVHPDRLELVVAGYGIGEESWRIDRRIITGDPQEEEIWRRLDDVLFVQRYRHECGDLMPISCTGIDSGFAAQQVYEYVKRRRARNVHAFKGMAGAGREILEPPLRKRRGKAGRPVEVVIVGVDSIKGLVYSRLRLLQRGPGFWHFPVSPAFDVEYFAQLCAEKRLTRYSKGRPRLEWVVVRPGHRNEALDCEVYAYAALCKLNPVWPAMEKRRAQIKARLAGEDGDGEGKEVEESSRTRQRKRGRQRGNFVTKYRGGRG